MAGFGAATPFAEPLWYSRGISPYYRESHLRLRDEVRQYVDTHITPFCGEWEEAAYVPPTVIQQHARLGYMAASVYPLAIDYLNGQRLPGDVATSEWDGFHDLIVIDEIARCGYLGVVWALTCGNSIGAPPLVNFGTNSQKLKFLPEIMSGRIRFCLGVTEPDAGSDVAGIKTTAVRQGSKYIVNGSKKWITNGIFADYCTTAVRTGGSGAGGISALIIPLNASGVTRRKIENSGVAASGSTYIHFDDVEVPIENLLGEENKGFEIIMSNFNHERLWLACTSLRMARVCALDAYQHATNRRTFGRRLIDNQTIRSKFAFFGRALDSSHALMEELVYLIERGKQSGRPVPGIGGLVANLKVLAGQTLERVNRESQQIMGGLGYAKGGRGARIEQISRDVRVMVVGGGSEEILTELAVKQEIRTIAGASRL